MTVKTIEKTTDIAEEKSYVEKELVDQKEIQSIYDEIQSVLKSKNPLDFYFKIKKIKNKIAKIIKSIIDEVVWFFDLNNNSNIYEIYYQTWYGENIKNHLKFYIEQSRYFDVRFYFIAVVLFDKEKQYLIKSLIKLCKWDNDKKINKYLKKFAKRTTLIQVKSIFEEFRIGKMKIAKKYMNENRPNIFMEKVFLKIKTSEDRNELLNSFRIRMNNYNFVKWKKDKQKVFQELIKIFWHITRNYIRLDRLDGQKDMEYMKQNLDIKTTLDQEIIMYFQNKNTFYGTITKLLEKRDVDKYICWKYIRTQMINEYFPEAKSLFYWNCVDEFQSNRLTWNSIAVEDEGNNNPYIKKLCNFKDMIISIQSNPFWTFWKPVVYSLILDTLKVDKKWFDKMFFIMCFIIANNHGEYKQLYRFFNEIRVIYWFNNRNIVANIFWKINLSLSIVIWLFIIFWWLYLVAPFALFVALVGLAIIYYVEYLSDNTISSHIRVNLWLKAYFTIAAIIFGFTFVINLWKQIDEWWSYSKTLNNISQMTTQDAMGHIEKWDFLEYSADIFRYGEEKNNKELTWNLLK